MRRALRFAIPVLAAPVFGLFALLFVEALTGRRSSRTRSMRGLHHRRSRKSRLRVVEFVQENASFFDRYGRAAYELVLPQLLV
jgi:hypothetical protein